MFFDTVESSPGDEESPLPPPSLLSSGTYKRIERKIDWMKKKKNIERICASNARGEGNYDFHLSQRLSEQHGY